MKLKNVNEKGKEIDLIFFFSNCFIGFIDIMQENFMRKIMNLNKHLIKLKMDFFHQKIQNYFMILSIVYYVTMEISMFINTKKEFLS